MHLQKMLPRWWMVVAVAIFILDKVPTSNTARDSQGRKYKKVKNLKGMKSLLRTMIMNDGPEIVQPPPALGGRQEENPGKRLMADLFTTYNKNVRPVRSPREAVRVGFGIGIIEVLNLEETNGHVKIHTWVKMGWKDAGLTWNPKLYDGMEEIHVPVTSIWKPDITLYNSAESEDPISTDVQAVIRSDGSVLYVAPATFRLTCRHEFRGNSWSCPFRFASWSYNGLQLDLDALEGKVDMDDNEYLMSDYFMIVEHKGRREVKTYPTAPDVPYPFMTYLLKLRSKIGPSLLG